MDFRIGSSSKPLFRLGRLYSTPGAQAAISPERCADLLIHHCAGDFGCVDAEDQETNRQAIEDGSRILSAYAIDPSKPCKGFGENTVWIITEAVGENGQRSATTILLPEEY